MKTKLNDVEWAMWVLVVIGAINWGLYGAFKFDLVATVLGTSPILAQVMYVVIGLAGVYTLIKMLTMKK
ncbi:DUF378 domain-containing protein [Candidatus Woesebacteria bacterium]|nr:DUF378 domain-containing protein [Candidatus Woesebacteria bacterium]